MASKADLGKLLKTPREETVQNLKSNREKLHVHPHHGPAETIREDTYKGHKIKIKTSYEITIDGKPITGHLGVSHEGKVHYHGLPTYSLPSAVDLVHQIIDSFPDDFQGTKPGSGPGDHSGQGHKHTKKTKE